MNKITGQKITWLLVQRNKETGDELSIYYNEYNGSLNPSATTDGATHFEDVETVTNLSKVQNMMATILKQKYEYIVVKEEISYVEVPTEPAA